MQQAECHLPHLPPPQVFKFTLYLTIPVGLTFGFVYNPERMERLTKFVRDPDLHALVLCVLQPADTHIIFSQYGYVNYPPAGPPPPTLEQIKAMLAQEKKDKAAMELSLKKSKGWLW